MTKRTQNSVSIPLSPLAADLAEAERIKHEMTNLLAQLEHQVTPVAPDQPGGWRRDPQGWAEQHKPTKS